MSFFNVIKKKLHSDDKDESSSSSFADKFKQFGHSDEDAALVQNVAHKAQQKASEDDDDVDLTNAQNAHKKIYEHDDDDVDDVTLGKAAAFEALKKYHAGEKTAKDKSELQKQFVAMAMSEGLEIWKKKNSGKGEAAGKKEEIMEQAATAAIKMLVKSEKSEKSEMDENKTEEDSSHINLIDLAKKFF